MAQGGPSAPAHAPRVRRGCTACRGRKAEEGDDEWVHAGKRKKTEVENGSGGLGLERSRRLGRLERKKWPKSVESALPLFFLLLLINKTEKRKG